MEFFFFQAEDGIRDHCVTGVQTCALPILGGVCNGQPQCEYSYNSFDWRRFNGGRDPCDHVLEDVRIRFSRSEERRVGKGVDLGGRRIIKKKKRRTTCDVTDL